jgi:hypothetical protein
MELYVFSELQESKVQNPKSDKIVFVIIRLLGSQMSTSNEKRKSQEISFNTRFGYGFDRNLDGRLALPLFA